MEILSSAPHTLHLFAEYACVAIEFISIIIILCGVAAAIARGLRLALSRRRAAKNEWLHLRLSLEETLMLGLQFLMAADIIIGTISNPDLQGVIVLTVIVLLRVVLSFTLSREVAEMDRREREAEGRAPSDEKHDADAPP